jgi:hypothetical protein
MATAQKGLRRIVIDGTAYAWRIRRKPTHFQSDYGNGRLHVAVQLAQEPRSVLVIHTDRPHPADWGTDGVVPVTPADLADWVRQAIEIGWDPLARGPQFRVKLSDNGVERGG